MDSKPITRENLYITALEANLTKRTYKIRTVSNEIINHVVSYSKNGCFTYKYPRCEHIQEIVSDIIAILKLKFPDCDIYYKSATENEYDGIIVNWS